MAPSLPRASATRSRMRMVPLRAIVASGGTKVASESTSGTATMRYSTRSGTTSSV